MSEEGHAETLENGNAGFSGWLFGNRSSDAACRWALLPLRLMLGLVFFVAGSGKAFGWFGGYGFAATVGYIRDTAHIPLPTFFTVLLIVAELGGGILLIAGVLPRLAAVGFAIAMTVALLTVLRGKGLSGTYVNQLVLAASATVFIAGSGPLSLMRSRPKSP
jgi:putative oxidoreductase